MLINKLAIIGVGLIGGSLARALKRAGECQYIAGYGRSKGNLERAVELGVIDEYSDDLGKVVRDADIIVLATPLMSFKSILIDIVPHLKTGALITDVGSVKQAVVADAREVLGEKIAIFVPGHPVAGTEKSGVDASFPELFEGHMVILTPVPENSDSAIEKVKRMWHICGANVVCMSAEHHDRVLAATSHLPHVLAYALVDCIASMDKQEDVFRFSAGGFRDFTRIASSNAEMWSDICLSNPDCLLQVIDDYREHLDRIARLITDNDRQGLKQLFSEVKENRDNYLLLLQSGPGLDNNGKS